MKTEMFAVDPADPDPRVIERCASLLREGRLVAFPTETVYGLGALADDETAARAIFVAKGRPSYNPLISHLPDVGAARALATAWSESAEALARAFWPGPLTIVVPRAPSIARVACGGLDAMALRVPDHPVALALLRATRRPIAAPSANRSNELSPTTAEHVRQQLDGRIDAILDGGPCRVGLESTVVDLCGPTPTVLRPGMITVDQLRAIVGAVHARAPLVTRDQPRTSPGMDVKHYAPRAKLSLATRAELQRVIEQRRGKIGVITVGDARIERGATVVHRPLPSDAEGFSAALYGALHALDDVGCDEIVCEQVPDGALWDAARDRLTRASS